MGEWAVRGVSRLLQRENAAVLGRVRLPLWVNLEVLLHLLVANEHLIVAPVRRGHLRPGHDLRNQHL